MSALFERLLARRSAAAIVLGVALATFVVTTFRFSATVPFLALRTAPSTIAMQRILVEPAGFSNARRIFSSKSLEERAQLLSTLSTTRPVLAEIGGRADVGSVSPSPESPTTGDLATPDAAVAATSSTLSAVRLAVTAPEQSPVVEVTVRAPDAATARRTVSAAGTVLNTLVSDPELPGPEPLQPLGPATTVTTSTSGQIVFGALSGIAAGGGFAILLSGAARLRRTLARERARPPQPASSNPAGR